MEKMHKFLSAVRTAEFRSGQMPRVWKDEYREALSNSYVAIHFGGSVRLTEAGHEVLTSSKKE